MQGVFLCMESLPFPSLMEQSGLSALPNTAGAFRLQTLLVQMGGSEDTERSISHMKFGFL